MFKLYIANKNYSSWSLRPWVLLKQLGIRFEEILTPFGEVWDAGEVRQFLPSGRVPCLHDDEVVVWDSLAITEYLAELEKGVWPREKLARAWARSATAEMHSGFAELRDRCTVNCGIRVRLHDFGPKLQRDWARIDELWNQGLTTFGGPFLAGGTFTAVDAFYCPVAFRVQTYEPPLSSTARQYADRLLALPAMREWYTAAIAEPWREWDHEQEARQTGTWLQDYRQ